MHSAFRSTPVRTALLVGAAAIFVINSIPSTGGTRAPADDHTIEAYIDAQVADAGYPGASLAVIRGGHVSDIHPIGAADGSGRPVGTETPFVIGSLSKSLTALATLRLVDAGRLELDAPVSRYLPAFRTATVGPASTPGTHFAYANANYVVLGSVIEAASERPYAVAMQSLVFGPLGMT